MTDFYDRQIAHLLGCNADFDAQVEQHWTEGLGLFAFVYPGSGSRPDRCGCLTMIRRRTGQAYGPDGVDAALTAAICADARLPTTVADITPEHLPVFAAWQRRLDERFARSSGWTADETVENSACYPVVRQWLVEQGYPQKDGRNAGS